MKAGLFIVLVLAGVFIFSMQGVLGYTYDCSGCDRYDYRYDRNENDDRYDNYRHRSDGYYGWYYSRYQNDRYDRNYNYDRNYYNNNYYNNRNYNYGYYNYNSYRSTYSIPRVTYVRYEPRYVQMYYYDRVNYPDYDQGNVYNYYYTDPYRYNYNYNYNYPGYW